MLLRIAGDSARRCSRQYSETSILNSRQRVSAARSWLRSERSNPVSSPPRILDRPNARRLESSPAERPRKISGMSSAGPKRRKTTSARMSAIGGTSGLLVLRMSFVARDPMYGPAVRCKRFRRSGGCGLASMYPVSDWSLSRLPTIMDISARATLLADRPLWTIRVTSVRTRREDRSSISSDPLADLGG